MKKILLILFVLVANISFAQYGIDENAIYLDINKNVGIGIKTPTSRLHVFGNGTASNLFKLDNNKGTYNDSSIIVKANGTLILGDSSYILQSIDNPLSESRLTIVGGTPLRLLNGNNIGYTSLKWSALTDQDTIADYAQIMGGVMRNTYNNNRGELYFQTKGVDGMRTRMYIDSSGYVGIGTEAPLYPVHVFGSANAGANIYSEYSGSTTSSAIKGYASGSAGYGIMGTASTIGAKGGLFENTASGIALDLRADNGTALRIISGYVIVNSIQFHSITTTLSDNSTYALPTGYSWKGEIDVDSSGYSLFTAQIRCDADGTPYLEGVSWKRWSSITYVEVGSTDGYLNITDGGSGMAITNKLGYTIDVTLRFRRKQ